MTKDIQKLSRTKKAEKKDKPSKKKIVETAKENLKKNIKPKRYWEAVGRRKTATCRVRIFPCRPFDVAKERARITVNDKAYYIYFPTQSLQKIVESALNKMKSLGRFKVTVSVKGGGIKSQAEAIKHGIARALVKFNPDFKKRLKRAGYLTRDPRMKERKKPGLKKARRARQWRKR